MARGCGISLGPGASCHSQPGLVLPRFPHPGSELTLLPLGPEVPAALSVLRPRRGQTLQWGGGEIAALGWIWGGKFECKSKEPFSLWSVPSKAAEGPGGGQEHQGAPWMPWAGMESLVWG